jgi:hypothetical protein
MQNHLCPFNIDLAMSISQDTTNFLLKNFKNIQILDKKDFTEKRGYTPCVSSIFIVSEGGSYYYLLNSGEDVYIHNGSVGSLIVPSGCMPFNQFSEKYEKAVFQIK